MLNARNTNNVTSYDLFLVSELLRSLDKEVDLAYFWL
jgi:hypothetical protein